MAFCIGVSGIHRVADGKNGLGRHGYQLVVLCFYSFFQSFLIVLFIEDLFVLNIAVYKTDGAHNAIQDRENVPYF